MTTSNSSADGPVVVVSTEQEIGTVKPTKILPNDKEQVKMNTPTNIVVDGEVREEATNTEDSSSSDYEDMFGAPMGSGESLANFLHDKAEEEISVAPPPSLVSTDTSTAEFPAATTTTNQEEEEPPQLPVEEPLQSTETNDDDLPPATTSEPEKEKEPSEMLQDTQSLLLQLKENSSKEVAPKTGGSGIGSTLASTVRKGAVAITGGTLTAVGLVMIPLPTPMGCVVAASGMALLGTEFEGANRVLKNAQTSAEAARDKLIVHVESTIEDHNDSEEEGERGVSKKDIVIQKAKTTVAVTGTDDVSSTNNEDRSENKNQQQQGDGDDSSEWEISVNADGYFDPQEGDESANGKKPTTATKANVSWWQSTRKRMNVETRGFLATKVLPALHMTKQFSSNNNNTAEGEGNEGAKATEPSLSS